MSNATSPWEQLRNRVLTIEQVRRVDQLAVDKYGMHSLVLMENAALGCVQWLQDRRISMWQQAPPRTVILCGTGNNGGDGLAIARHLRYLGWPCEIFVAGPLAKLSVDARANADILLVDAPQGLRFGGAVPAGTEMVAAMQQADLVIDALLGTGASGNPRPPADEWVEQANRSQAFRLAIDIPTGVNATTGERGSPSFEADATLTFVARKPAMSGAQAHRLFGELQVLPIGIPAGLMEELMANPS